MITRRDVVKVTGLALGAGLLLPRLPVALAQSGQSSGPQASGSADVAALMQPGPLGDVWQGPEDAKVTVIEYASMTCGHCARWHKEVYPTFKERYIDTGKVRFTLREFPLDPRATAGFMLARCDGNAMYYPITDLLFDQQPAWAFVKPPQSPIDALDQLLRQAGFNKEKIEKCLADQKTYTAVNGVKQRALDTFKVDSTPTFFINGQKYNGEMPIEDIEKVIKPIIGS